MNKFLAILTHSCGSLIENHIAKVRSRNLPELESLAEAIFDFKSIADLEKWFESKKQLILEHNKN